MRLLIETSPRRAAMNMAIDEVLCEVGKPVLRFYTWQPYALSLGYFQALTEVDQGACRAQGIDVVRRLTGGRAVLHAQEITYSLVLPEGTPGLPSGITAAYRYLSRGLAQGLAALGIEVEAVARAEPGGGGAACFAAPSWYELTVAGKKLVGSAQVRRQGVLLQHGSIPLYFSAGAVTRLLTFPTAAKRAQATRILEAKAIGLAQVCSDLPPLPELCQILSQGFAKAFGWVFTPSPGLSQAEEEKAAELAQAKYATQAWLARR